MSGNEQLWKETEARGQPSYPQQREAQARQTQE